MRKLGSLRFLWCYFKPYKQQMAYAFLAVIAASGSVLSMGWGLRYLIDQGFAAENAALLDRSILVLLGLVVIMAIASFVRLYNVTWVGEKATAQIRKDLYHKLIHQGADFFETMRVGELLSRLTADTTLIQTVIATSLPVAFRNVILFVGGMALLMISSPFMTLYVLALVPVVLLPIALLGRKVRVRSKDAQGLVAEVGAHAEETLGAWKVVQSFVNEKVEAEKFSKSIDLSFLAAVKRLKMRGILSSTVMVLVFTGISFLLWYGGKRVLAGTMTPGDLSSFVFYAILVAGSVSALSEVIGDVYKAAGAAERLQELVNLSVPMRDAAGKLASLCNGKIVFNQVVFAYPTAPEINVHQGLSFTVNPGETIAIVGLSGAGKSTVFDLLLGFYAPQSGHIQIDQQDIQKLSLAHVRRNISVVSQEPTLFDMPVIENIRYGRLDATDEEVEIAAKVAGADDFINRLKQGYQTGLGPKGVRLSGGQKQKIALARAFLRQAPILLLDEATSHLDAQAEAEIRESLKQVSAGKTTLIIAHRLATVMEADKILVLDQGRIVTQGKHEELMRESEIYSNIAALQFIQI